MGRAGLTVRVAGTVGMLALSGVGTARAQAPYGVSAASLVQQGQSLVWSVRLGRPFYPESLKRAHVSLCLLIERPSGTTRRTVCLAPGPHRRPPPRLVVGGHAIAATVTISKHRTLEASFLPSAIGIGYTRLRWRVQLGGSLFPGRGQLLRLHTPRLVGCQASGPTFVYHGPANVREIALTFDDGPWPDPPSIDFVNELARLHVPGTFFEIGEQIGTYDPSGSVERAMLRGGDMIGDHTWTHPDMPGLRPAAQRAQIAMTAAAIKRATGFRPCLFRAPYGSVNAGLLGLVRSMGMTTIQWNDDTRDWSTPGVGAIESTALSEASNGGIILMHFGGGPRSETLEALPDIVGRLRARGYRFVTVTQMLGYRLLYK